MLLAWRSMKMLLFLFLICFAVAQLGSIFTTEQSFIWYKTLCKPSWVPPDFVFPIVWTILYTFMAIAAWLVWRAKKSGYSNALICWDVQLILNAMWTPVFFGQAAIFYGLVILVSLWLVLAITTVIFFKHSRLAGFLMLIYLLWVSYASVINFMIWQMN